MSATAAARRPLLRRFDLWLGAAALLFACVLAYATVNQGLMHWHFRLPFPFWDMFGINAVLDTTPRPGILHLYRTVRDNEHRPVVTFLFYVWDRHAYGDSGELLYRAIMVSNAVLALSLAGAVAVAARLARPIRLLFATAVSASLFCLMHYDNLTWQKQIHEISCMALLSVGVLCAALVSVRGDAARRPGADIGLAVAAGLCCLAATYSFAFGLAAWPAVLAHAMLTRWRPAPLLAFVLFAAFAIVTYALTYRVLRHHTHPLQAAGDPLAMALFILRTLGAPLFHMLEGIASPAAARLVAELAGAAAAAAALAMGVLAYRRRPPSATRGERVAAHHGAMLLAALSGMAVMIALGRLTINHGLDSRYLVLASMFWCALGATLAVMLPRRAAIAAVFGFAAFAVAVAAVPVKRFENALRWREQDMYRAGVLATARLHVPNFPSLYPSPRLLFAVWHRPRPPGEAFARRAPFGWIGESIAGLPRAPASNDCRGTIEAFEPGLPGQTALTVSGWALAASDTATLRWIVVTDEAQRGVGVGKPGILRYDIRNRFRDQGIAAGRSRHLASGFRIAALSTPGSRLLLWGIDDAGRVCALGDYTPR